MYVCLSLSLYIYIYIRIHICIHIYTLIFAAGIHEKEIGQSTDET